MRVGVSIILLLGLFVGGAWAQDGAALEAALGLTRADRRVIQSSLAAQGFDPGPADGLFGRRTRAAIGRWQGARGEEQTGYLNAENARLLLARPPEAPEPTATRESVETGLGLTREDRRAIQSSLAAQGFDPGPADGVFGRRTRAAIGRWQGARGEQPTGYLDAEAAKSLLAPAAEREREAEETAEPDISERERQDSRSRETAAAARSGGRGRTRKGRSRSKSKRQKRRARDRGCSKKLRQRRNASGSGERRRPKLSERDSVSSEKRKPNVRGGKDSLGRACVTARRVRNWSWCRRGRS